MTNHFNWGHKEVAENLIQQAMKGEAIHQNEALKAAGYYTTENRVIKSENFQKILLKTIPYEAIVAMQQKQVVAAYIKRLHWGKDSGDELEDIVKKCTKLGWNILRCWTEADNSLVTLLLLPDHEQIDKALDKIYKLAGLYSPERIEQVDRPLEEKTDAELMKIIAQALDKKKAIDGEISSTNTDNANNAQA
jgi:hypothetical protein